VAAAETRQGIGVSPGTAHGPVVQVAPPVRPPETEPAPADTEAGLAEVKAAFESVAAALEAQADKIVANLAATSIQVAPDDEIIALIAFLQRLGTEGKKHFAQQAAQTSEAAPAPAQGTPSATGGGQ